MGLLKKLFTRKNRRKSRKDQKDAGKELVGGEVVESGSTVSAEESRGGNSSSSSSSVLERTRVHVSSVVEVKNPTSVLDADFEDDNPCCGDGEDNGDEGGDFNCFGGGGDDQQSKPDLAVDTTAAAAQTKTTTHKKKTELVSPRATESIECVFNENRQDPDDLIPSLIGSMSMSTIESMDSPYMTALLGSNEMMRVEPQPCRCGIDCLPPDDTKLWPQAPLLLRPKPNSGTKIIGIRKENTRKYLWKPSYPHGVSWWRVLQNQWKDSDGDDTNKLEGFEPAPCCEQCVILPINNGNEGHGESLVADFETDLFKGTLLMRLRHAEGTTKEPYDDTKGYFHDVPFRYQAVIRGRFKEEMPYTELVTGTRLDRPCGKLPPKWVTWTGLKVMGFFAPQLRAKLDIARPLVLTPFGSAPRVIEVDKEKPTDFLGDARAEPTTAERSLTGKVYKIKNALERARARKRHFDNMYIAHDKTIQTDPSKTYTMEFLQHLFDYQKYTIDLGTLNFDMNDLLDGQPLQLMAARGRGDDEKLLWSFEIWNECLLRAAKKHAFAARNQGWSLKYTATDMGKEGEEEEGSKDKSEGGVDDFLDDKTEG